MKYEVIKNVIPVGITNKNHDSEKMMLFYESFSSEEDHSIPS